MSGTRYPISAVMRARELRDAEWTFRDIARLIERETGLCPAATTVQLWCASEKSSERRRRLLNDWSARKRASKRQPEKRRTEEWKLATMRELFLRGVGLRAIGHVAAVWWGEELTERQVRTRLGVKSVKQERSAA